MAITYPNLFGFRKSFPIQNTLSTAALEGTAVSIYIETVFNASRVKHGSIDMSLKSSVKNPFLSLVVLCFLIV